MTNWRNYQNYAIIAVVSLIAVFVLPFWGAEVGMTFQLPTTTSGWVVFISSKLMVAAINLLLLYAFYDQGKFNVRDNKHYLEACEILRMVNDTEENKPKSPKAHATEVFGKKGITLFITSVLSTFSLTQAILTFDPVTMISYIITVVIGIVFGLYQMNQEEIYWTEDFWRYAKQQEILLSQQGIK